MQQRIHKSSSWNPPTQQQNSQLTSHSLPAQAQQNSPRPLTQLEQEEVTFKQQRYEADILQLKEKMSGLTSGEQEKLGVLQAKMNDFWAQKRARESRASHNLADIDISYSRRRRPFQPKLSIGEPNDKYEQEADAIASQVVEQINSPVTSQKTQGLSVQRQDKEDEEIQPKPEITTLQRQEESEEEELQAKLSNDDLQRSPLLPEIQLETMPEEEKEEDLQTKSTLQRQKAIGSGEASTDLESAINNARGGGQSLEAGLQQSMGQAMGADFSGVKVHTDAQSDQLNQSIQAKAFTTGQDVFFRQGEYNPGSREGQELIAHELTHVVQQKSNVVQQKSQQQAMGKATSSTTNVSNGCNCGLCLGGVSNKSLLQRTSLADAVIQRVPLGGQTQDVEDMLSDYMTEQGLVPGNNRAIDNLYALIDPDTQAHVIQQEFRTVSRNLGGIQELEDIADLINISDIRSANYPSSFNAAAIGHRNAYIANSSRQNNTPNHWICPGVPQNGRPPHQVNILDRSIDHIMPVAVHWNNIGHNTDRATRNQWYNDITNHEILCRSCNSSKGSGNIRYTANPGPNYQP